MQSENQDAVGAYWKARVWNLRSQIPMTEVLEAFGIQIQHGDRQIQHPCPLHGDGLDSGFSARAYPDEPEDPGGHSYCWGCQKARDQIAFVREMKGFTFIQAVKFLEREFEVTKIPDIYAYFDPKAGQRDPKSADQGGFLADISAILGVETARTPSGGVRQRKVRNTNTPKATLLERDLNRIETKLRRIVNKREIPMRSATTLYYLADRLRYEINNPKVFNTEPDLLEARVTGLMTKVDSLLEKYT